MSDQVFFWIGVFSSAFFVLLGMAIFAAWVMDIVWRKFRDGKNLADIILCWKEYGLKAAELRAAEINEAGTQETDTQTEKPQ